MSTRIHIEQLLRWRLARAEAEAPAAPRAARLVQWSRPWWEAMPERLQSLVDRLYKIQFALGHAMAEPRPSRTGAPVPALIAGAGDEVEASARILYFSIQDGRLRLRFELSGAPGPEEAAFEVTFISEADRRPLLSAPAARSVDQEYRLDAELPEDLARSWEQVKVTDRMPFRWILRAAVNGG